MFLISEMASSVILDEESFLQPAGIYEKTLEDLFRSEIFFLGRESIHVTFFFKFMVDDASCIALQRLLYELLLLYFESYRKNVSTTAGDIEKRIKSGKVMVVNFENDRNDAREIYREKFIFLSVVRMPPRFHHLPDEHREEHEGEREVDGELVHWPRPPSQEETAARDPQLMAGSSMYA